MPPRPSDVDAAELRCGADLGADQLVELAQRVEGAEIEVATVDEGGDDRFQHALVARARAVARHP
jgi:hypothetical protein